IFFFSSRRRHTRCYRDWSSDVCSSDLLLRIYLVGQRSRWRADVSEAAALSKRRGKISVHCAESGGRCGARALVRREVSGTGGQRSEERRVGKECGCGGGAEQERQRGE